MLIIQRKYKTAREAWNDYLCAGAKPRGCGEWQHLYHINTKKLLLCRAFLLLGQCADPSLQYGDKLLVTISHCRFVKREILCRGQLFLKLK